MNDSLNYTLPRWQTTARCQMGLAICPLGIVSSILTILSLWKRVLAERKIFFILMIIIAVLDLFFNCGYIFIRCAAPSYTRAAMKGAVFSASLAADLCALALTAERYLVLCWSRTMKNLSPRTANVVRAAVSVVICMISLVRMQYIVEDLDAITPLSGGFKKYWDPIYVGLSIYGDMVLPFILTVAMVVFSSGIIRAVVNRRRARKKVHANRQGPYSIHVTNNPIDSRRPNSAGEDAQRRQGADTADHRAAKSILGIPTPKSQNKVDDGHTVISLVLILDIFFVSNQLGYCFFAMAGVYKTECQECDYGVDLYQTATFVSDFIECLSRSMNFYFYVKFSQLLRKDFLDFLNKVKVAVLSRLYCVS